MGEWNCCLGESVIDFQFFTAFVHLRGCLSLEQGIVTGNNGMLIS